MENKAETSSDEASWCYSPRHCWAVGIPAGVSGPDCFVQNCDHTAVRESPSKFALAVLESSVFRVLMLSVTASDWLGVILVVVGVMTRPATESDEPAEFLPRYTGTMKWSEVSEGAQEFLGRGDRPILMRCSMLTDEIVQGDERAWLSRARARSGFHCSSPVELPLNVVQFSVCLPLVPLPELSTTGLHATAPSVCDDSSTLVSGVFQKEIKSDPECARACCCLLLKVIWSLVASELSEPRSQVYTLVSRVREGLAR